MGRRRIDSANLVRSHAACGARITLLSGVGVRCRVYVWLPVCKRSETEKAENVKGKMSQTAIKGKADSTTQWQGTSHGTVRVLALDHCVNCAETVDHRMTMQRLDLI